MINRIRKIGGEFILNKELKNTHRNKSIQDIADIKKIAILHNISNEEDYINVLKIARSFQAEKKTVNIVSFIDRKTIPNYLIPTITFDVITLKDLNFFKIPKNNFVNDFINFEYDLLIDLSDDENFVLKYLLALSKSKLKVGDLCEQKKKYLDLMIKKTNKKNIELFVKNIIHYLTVLNKK